MALSNWDTVAFGPDGKPGNGELLCPGGQGCRLYKNWLYITDPKGWGENSRFSEPVVAELQEGDLQIAGMHISGRRGSQNSIFVMAEYSDYPKDKEPVFLHMAGVTGYGFDDPTDRILKAWGKPVPAYDDAWNFSSYEGPGKEMVGVDLVKEDEAGEYQLVQRVELPKSEELESKWVGVQPETLKEFFFWLDATIHDEFGQDAKDWAAKDREGALRFNQGDAYLAKKAGETVPTTPVGEAEEPILTKAFKGLHK